MIPRIQISVLDLLTTAEAISKTSSALSRCCWFEQSRHGQTTQYLSYEGYMDFFPDLHLYNTGSIRHWKSLAKFQHFMRSHCALNVFLSNLDSENLLSVKYHWNNLWSFPKSFLSSLLWVIRLHVILWWASRLLIESTKDSWTVTEMEEFLHRRKHLA